MLSSSEARAQYIGAEFINATTVSAAGATASGGSSTAVGKSSTASGNFSTAIGQFSKASGLASTALGESSTASGAASTALGVSSTASGDFSTALGELSTAGFANSTAIGAGSATTRDNQMVFGTAANTYTAPGITSAASLAAQTGPTRLVTSDAGGNLATADPNSVVMNSSAFQNLQSDVRQNTEGTAIAIALGGAAAILPEDKTFAASMNWGNFQGQNALGFGGVGRVNDNWFLNAGIGVGMNQGTTGGRAGVTYAW